MLKEDFVIQSNIRRMLIRTSIDCSRIDFGTVKGVVYIRGIFQISNPPADGDEAKTVDLTIHALYSLEKKVKSIPGVVDVNFQFFNWRKQRGHWVPVDVREKEGEDENKPESNL
jgi:hypothetical protein